jgi:hypothetical protein
MGGEQSAPSMRQSGQLATHEGNERAVVGVAGQLIEHVEPLPHRLPEDLAQNLVHLFAPPFRPCGPGPENVSPGKVTTCAPAVAPGQGRQSAG